MQARLTTTATRTLTGRASDVTPIIRKTTKSVAQPKVRTNTSQKLHFLTVARSPLVKPSRHLFKIRKVKLKTKIQKFYSPRKAPSPRKSPANIFHNAQENFNRTKLERMRGFLKEQMRITRVKTPTPNSNSELKHRKTRLSRAVELAMHSTLGKRAFVTTVTRLIDHEQGDVLVLYLQESGFGPRIAKKVSHLIMELVYGVNRKEKVEASRVLSKILLKFATEPGEGSQLLEDITQGVWRATGNFARKHRRTLALGAGASVVAGHLVYVGTKKAATLAMKHPKTTAVAGLSLAVAKLGPKLLKRIRG